MSSSPFDIFETDESLETSGINLDYGDFEITVARAGGANTKFEKAMLDVHKKNQFKLEHDLFTGAEATRTLAEVYAETVILGWRSKEFGEGKLKGKDGKPLEFSRKSVVDLLVALPALFADIRSRAGKLADFRKTALESDVKNS